MFLILVFIWDIVVVVVLEVVGWFVVGWFFEILFVFGLFWIELGIKFCELFVIFGVFNKYVFKCLYVNVV